MKNNKGFIATSLIYSFFLVFIAIIAALLNNYLANKNILERYSEKVSEELNTNSYNLSVYLKNSEVVGGTFFTNILNYGANGESKGYWNCSSCDLWYQQCCSASETENIITFSSNSSATQNSIYFEKTSKYYFEIDYDSIYYYPTLKIGDKTIGDNDFNDKKYKKDKQKIYGIYEFNEDISKYLNVTIQNSGGSSRFYNIRILKISDKYDNAEWIKDNMDWFSGTVSFYIKKHISDETISFKTIVSSEEMLDKIDCKNATISSKNKKAGEIYYTITLANITGDVVCTDY